MSDFGHVSYIGPDICIDSWGVGPFLIEAAGKHYRFDDSDRFGPSLVNKHGDTLKNPWPGERCPFWRAHWLWKHQGRRLETDGVTCIYDLPKPTTYRVVGREMIIVEAGEPDMEERYVRIK